MVVAVVEVVNNADVRRVYDRAQFERIWIAASGGTAYVIRNS